MNEVDTITCLRSRSGRLISYDPDRDLLLVEGDAGQSVIVVDLARDRVTIRSAGDLDLEAGGKLTLRGEQGVEVQTPGDLKLVSESETVVRGRMVRIN